MTNTEIEIKITQSLITQVAKGNNLLLFLAYSNASQIISHLVIKHEELAKSVEQVRPGIISSYENYKIKLEDTDKGISEFYSELGYRLVYQSFEEHLFELFTVLFHAFPVFLKKENFDLNFETLFEQDDILIARRKIIEKRAKKYIQSNNIKSIITKFRSIFGIELSIKEEKINELFVASQIRNILTHNNGIVNDIFLSELSQQKINTEYDLDDSVINDLENQFYLLKDLTGEIGQEIINQLIKKLPQIRKYSYNI